MLKTITEEPVVKEGKGEIAVAREARGPKPMMIKKQQSIDDEDLVEKSMALDTNRTGLQIGSEDEHAQTQDVLKSI